MIFDAASIVIFFYSVCALIILLFLGFYKLVNQPEFRGADESTEAGYEEDGTGHILSTPEDEEEVFSSLPHADVSANMHSGPF